MPIVFDNECIHYLSTSTKNSNTLHHLYDNIIPSSSNISDNTNIVQNLVNSTTEKKSKCKISKIT